MIVQDSVYKDITCFYFTTITPKENGPQSNT